MYVCIYVNREVSRYLVGWKVLRRENRFLFCLIKDKLIQQFYKRHPHKYIHKYSTYIHTVGHFVNVYILVLLLYTTTNLHTACIPVYIKVK